MYKIFIVVILVCCFSSVAKHPTKERHFKGTPDIESWILDHYHPDSARLSNICQSSCVFVRFNISNGRKISNVAFNKHIPAFITDAMAESVKSLEKDTAISNDAAPGEKTYLFPFIYDYRSGCKDFYDQKQLIIIQKDGTGNTVTSQLTGEAIFNMLNFTDKKFMALDCIILNPISVSNVVMY